MIFAIIQNHESEVSEMKRIHKMKISELMAMVEDGHIRPHEINSILKNDFIDISPYIFELLRAHRIESGNDIGAEI